MEPFAISSAARRWDDERARELEAHLAIETDENIARGMTPTRRARTPRAASSATPTRVREEIYQMNTIALARQRVAATLRYGARLLRLNPGFAAVAILSLALGVGANTAIFQLLDAVRLRTLPVAQSEPSSSRSASRTPRADGPDSSRAVVRR